MVVKFFVMRYSPPTDQRRRLMQRVRRENTAPEGVVANALKMAGIRFRKNCKALPGKPDFYFPSANTVLFVHGCFWHGHSACKKGRTSTKVNTHYWRTKIERNQARDRRVVRRLRRLGYGVFTVWACNVETRPLPTRLLLRLISSLPREHDSI